MRKSELTSILESPGEIRQEQIPALQEVLSEYPYFTSAQLLLSKAFQQSENLNFERQLRLSAAYAADRKMLHHLIHNLEFIETEKEGIDKKVQEPPFSEAEKEKINDSKEQREEDAFLESQILTSAINSSIMLEVGEEEETLVPPDFNKKEAEELKVEVSLPAFDEQSEHSFGDWLKHFGGEGIESRQHTDSTKIKALHTISEQAKAIQKKAEFYSASKMAKLSVQESDDLVTQTLAEVYEAQGRFDKALQAYQKLQLKFPEKRVYFAGRIKAVEEKLNS